MIYCVAAKLIISIAATIWTCLDPRPLFWQGFLIGALPIWAEVLASHVTQWEPARTQSQKWLRIDGVVDAWVFIVAPLNWWSLIHADSPELRFAEMLFFILGLTRIIRFIKTGLDTKGYFQGLPVTYTGYMWPIFTLLPLNLQPRGSAAILVVAAILMILPYRFIKASR